MTLVTATHGKMTEFPGQRARIPTMAVALLLVVVSSIPLAAQTILTIAAAADVQPLMQEMVRRYEEDKQGAARKISVVVGSSGNLATQIENGAPYDLFFSADEGFPRRLVNERKANADSFQVYALGKLVIWAPAGSKLDVEHLGAKALLDASVQKVAIANPQHAPYGRAAIEALKNLGLYERIESKLVLGENVSQAAQFVGSGNAQAGVIALSLVQTSAMKSGRYWMVPQQAYTPLRQAVVMIAGAKHPEAARAFLDFFLRQRDPQLLVQFGFELPPVEERK